ncbi:LysE family translocator [Cognatishimia sp. F0-27]|uniref:LysE family translocator n=1 Tax=Cognatishimia sp. F0-27 TaxID=2816855 RepID=UPI001D0C2333|nr:LysE family transporter [Cognatishimia sp. F0-27]MCC1492694.1 LysE family transporter [Cognatishimia sp. F0-27]
MTLAAFVSVALVHLVAAMSPGPSFVVCVRLAVTDGFGSAAALALGFGLGAVLWASAAMAGLTLLFELVPALFLAIKIIGAAFLLYIAAMMWRHATAPLPAAGSDRPKTPLAAMRLGFATFASNPKTAVFFGAVFAGLLPQDASLLDRGAVLLIVFANETLWYLLVARVFSHPRARSVYGRIKATLDRVFGTLIALFGVKIALS